MTVHDCVICPVDSLFKIANNTVLRGGYCITCIMYNELMIHDVWIRYNTL